MPRRPQSVLRRRCQSARSRTTGRSGRVLVLPFKPLLWVIAPRFATPSGVPTPRHVKAAASAGLNGGGSLLHNPSAAGRVQVIPDGGFTGEEKFHPIQGRLLCIIPGGPAAAGQAGNIPINIALPNDDL